jgi:hypothetical protein
LFKISKGWCLKYQCVERTYYHSNCKRKLKWSPTTRPGTRPLLTSENFENFIFSCKPRDTDRLCIAQLKRELLKKLDDKMWITDIHYIATFLHPETKSLSVSNICWISVRKMLKTVGITEESLELSLWWKQKEKK